MPSGSDEADERAERALAALREGRPPPVDRGSRDRLLDLAERALAAPRALVAAAAVAVVVALVVSGLVALRMGGGSADGGSGAEGLPFAGTGPSTTAATTTTLAPGIVVHAAGAVRTPGLYRLDGGARVADLVDAAGGPADDVDLDRVNLAAPLVDGQRVYVPRLGEEVPPAVGTGGAGPGETGSGGASVGPVALNTATVDELDTLPGVGPTTAQAIVDHRTRNGPFRSVEDLLEVRGIGPAKLEALRDLVTVG